MISPAAALILCVQTLAIEEPAPVPADAAPPPPTEPPPAAAPAPAVVEAPAPPPPTPAPALPPPRDPERPRVLVMDLRNDGVDAAIVRTMEDQLAVALEKKRIYDVVTSEDVRRVLNTEADRRALCDQASDSCIAEMANALGARYVLHGSVAKLGDVMVLSVSLFDSEQARSVGRETFRADAVEDLPDVAQEAVDALTGTQKESVPLGIVVGVPLGLVGGVALIGGVIATSYGVSVTNENGKAGGPTESEFRDAQTVGIGGIAATALGAILIGGAAASFILLDE